MSSIPLPELEGRWSRLRSTLTQTAPEAEGIIVFSRVNIYYLTGSFSNGLFWLPLEGRPVLLCRRGQERAKLESPLSDIYSFKTYGDIEGILKEAGSPLPNKVAVEMNGLSWTLGKSLTKSLPAHEFLRGDQAIAMARAVKTEMEREILRDAGARHEKCMIELLPPLVREGMTELEIAQTIFNLFLAEGHQGILRMDAYGEEVFLGHISIGDSGNYPSVFNGALGLRGVHPAVPHMGSNEKVWSRGEPLTADCGFNLNGYQTDKTQVYWLGDLDSIPREARAAHDFCIEMQSWLSENLKPGEVSRELWSYCVSWAQKSGWEEGFMGLGGNKVEFVGHGIGLAIDEYPVIAKGFDQPLEEGMVLAIEPKIGIPGFGMVGVENTFEVTGNGGQSLTGDQCRIVSVPCEKA